MKEAFEDLVFDVLFPNQDIIFQFLNEIDFSLEPPKVLEELLLTYFRRNSKIRLNCSDIDWKQLSCSGAFFVRVYCQYFFQNEERIEELIPGVTCWTNTILCYVVILMEQDFSAEMEFLLSELLNTAKYLNLSDESGRRKLCELLSSFCC